MWRWSVGAARTAVIKIEFLADLDDQPNQATIRFDGCDELGAANLRGTGFAARDWELRPITAEIDGAPVTVELRVATLPAYLLAKTHAAYARGLSKDWYDIAYVTLHNDAGGPGSAADRVLAVFGDDLRGQTETALGELAANFADADGQGSTAYARTMVGLHPDLDVDVLANDAIAAMALFVERLGISR